MFPFDLGFLGGGQLARMSIQAAQRMGLKCLSLDSGTETPASQIAPAAQGKLSDPDSIAELLKVCAIVTLENEFTPATAIRQACEASGRPIGCVVPGVDCLETIQDKMRQRQALAQAGVPAPSAVPVDDDGALAVAKIGFPMVLKSRFGGYDGKGIRYAHNAEEFEDLRSVWEDGGWLAESFVPFRRELAVMVFRTPHQTGCFPTMETVQSNHVCDLVYPAEVDASQIAIAAVEAIQGIGLFGVELFEGEDGTLSVNEIAPRPHNSGHYTLDWGGASQFDQHIRVALGLPCVPLDGVPTCMANVLAQPSAGEWRRGMIAAIEGDPGIRVHWYGKTDARPGRKMGHINAVGGDIVDRARVARERFYKAWIEGGGESREEVG